MALPISSEIKRWASLQSRGPVAELYEVEASDTETLYYVLGDPTKTGSLQFPLDADGNPTAEAKTYTAIAIKRDDITQSIRAELPTFKVSVSNITGVAGGLIENYELDGRRVRITRVILDTLTLEDSISFDFTIQSQGYDRKAATFVIGFGNLFRRKLPWKKLVKVRCQHPWQQRFQTDNPCSFPSDYFGPNTEQSFGSESGRSIIVSEPARLFGGELEYERWSRGDISTASGKSGRTLEPIGKGVGEPPVYSDLYVHYFIPPQADSSVEKAFLAAWKSGTAWTTTGEPVNFTGTVTVSMVPIVETPVAPANEQEFRFRYERDDVSGPDFRIGTTLTAGGYEVEVTRNPVNFFRMPYRLDPGSADFVNGDVINRTRGDTSVTAQTNPVDLFGPADNGIHEREYGWNTLNELNATVFNVNRSTPNAMHIETTNPVATWTPGGENSPFAFKYLTGDFEVWTRVRPLSPDSSGIGGILVQSRKSGPLSDWVLWGHGLDNEGDERLVARSARNDVEGVTGEYETTDRYLKLERSGNSWTFSSSADGVTWTEQETRSVTLTQRTRLGLFVSSGGDSNAQTAYAFEGFRFLSGGPSTCDRLLNSLDGCLGRNNQHNFGAYSALPRR